VVNPSFFDLGVLSALVLILWERVRAEHERTPTDLSALLWILWSTSERRPLLF